MIEGTDFSTMTDEELKALMSDKAHNESMERIRAIIADSERKLSTEEVESVIDDASSLTDVEFDRLTKQLASRLGIRVGTLRNKRKERQRRAPRASGDSGDGGDPAHETRKSVVQRLNERYFCVENYGKRFRICAEEIDPEFASDPDFTESNNRILVPYRRDDFRAAFENKYVTLYGPNGETRRTDEGVIWIKSEYRRQYKTVTFAPGVKTSDSVYNLWRGWSVPPAAGDINLFRDHVFEVVCSGNQAYYDFLLKTLAWWFRHPNEHGAIAIVQRGAKGTGKDSFVRALARLVLNNFLAVSNPVHISGRFNSHLQHCWLLHLNEAFWGGDRGAEGTLKMLISDPIIPIEAKGIDVIKAKNHLHVIMSSNSDWIVPASPGDERRYFVLDVSEKRRGDSAYFDKLHKWIADSKNCGALLQHLLHEVSIDGFNPRIPLHTAALDRQSGHSLCGAEAIWFELLCSGLLPGGTKLKNGEHAVTTQSLIEWANKQNRHRWESNETLWGKLLGTNTNGSGESAIRPGMRFGKRDHPRRWVIPPLAACRALWEEKRFAPDAWEYAIQTNLTPEPQEWTLV